MKDFFKFDDKRIVSVLWLFISLCILILSICTIKVIEVFVATLFVLFITFLATIFTFNEGIHFDYKKEKITKAIIIALVILIPLFIWTISSIVKDIKDNLKNPIYVECVRKARFRSLSGRLAKYALKYRIYWLIKIYSMFHSF